MKKKRRAGATETFSVSVDKETKAILKSRAKRLYGGNMSQLITELGREVEKRDAFDMVREWTGGSVLTEEAVERIDRELDEGWTFARKQASKTKKGRTTSAA